jgi:hypothetical protein
MLQVGATGINHHQPLKDLINYMKVLKFEGALRNSFEGMKVLTGIRLEIPEQTYTHILFYNDTTDNGNEQ